MPQRNQRNADSALKALRDLVPHRPLSYSESLRLAELQANRLIELFDIEGPLVPNEIITELPRIEVRYDAELPVSGSAHWEQSRWVITLNASEPAVRQRFSLAHEFKHILDHTTKHFLYGDPSVDPRAADRAERGADVFAAALLMPKRWIKSRWFESGQNVAALAQRIGVSARALNVRLYYLGLAEDTRRCAHPTDAATARRGQYHRALSLVGASP